METVRKATGKNLKVIIRITDKCNMNCKYCYVSEEARKSSKIKLSLDSLRRFYEQTLSGQFSHIHIVWHGGEPTLVGHAYLDEAISLQSGFKVSGVEIDNSIQTNATTVNDHLIQIFKKHNIGVGVSLDAPLDMHDLMRTFWSDRPTSVQVLAGINKLRDSGLKFGAICVLHRLNFERCGEIYDFFKDLGLNYQFNPFYRDEATNSDITEQLYITPEQYAKALIQTFDRYTNDPNHTIDVSDLKDIIMSMFVGCSRSCLYAGKCEEFIGVLPTGEIYLCDLFYKKEYQIGHINFFTAEQMANSPVIQKIMDRPRHLQSTFCHGCEWWEICKGGCSSKSAAIYNDAMREDPFCESRKQLFAHISATLQNQIKNPELVSIK